MRYRPHHIQPAIEHVRIILCYRDVAGRGLSHAGLGISSANTAKALRRHGIWADVWAISSAERLRQRLIDVQAVADRRGEVPITHVVISAPWIPVAALAQLAAEFPEVVWTVNCHSNVGFLTADTNAVRIMRETAELQHIMHNIRVAGNSERFTQWASKAWSTRVAFLPNVYDLFEAPPPRRLPWTGSSLRIGMFGAARMLKNGITGAAAVVYLASKLRVPIEFHVSSGRDEGGSLRPIEEMVAGIPNITLVKNGWLPWPAFKTSIRHMHLHLQPSYTESFNVTVADAIAVGVPSVVGNAVHWVPEYWKADVDDPTDVARVAENLIRDTDAAEDGRRALEKYILEALVAWEIFLGIRD